MYEGRESPRRIALHGRQHVRLARRTPRSGSGFWKPSTPQSTKAGSHPPSSELVQTRVCPHCRAAEPRNPCDGQSALINGGLFPLRRLWTCVDSGIAALATVSKVCRARSTNSMEDKHGARKLHQWASCHAVRLVGGQPLRPRLEVRDRPFIERCLPFGDDEPRLRPFTCDELDFRDPRDPLLFFDPLIGMVLPSSSGKSKAHTRSQSMDSLPNTEWSNMKPEPCSCHCLPMIFVRLGGWVPAYHGVPGSPPSTDVVVR